MARELEFLEKLLSRQKAHQMEEACRGGDEVPVGPTEFAASVGHMRRRQWQPNPVLLPGKSHGWRHLVGCSPWGREESDTTE